MGRRTWRVGAFAQGAAILDSYHKAVVVGAERSVFDVHLSDVACESVLYIGDAVVDIVGVALCVHLHFAARDIADISCQVIASGDAVRGISESDTLHLAAKYDEFCRLH